jgi:hypothetical protein
MKLCHLPENGWTGNHHVKQNKPGLEKQASHIFSNM